jgi:hypothetical protein
MRRLLLLSTAALAQQPAHRTSRYHRATPYHATAPAAGKELAYYCASGNTVKYHSSATCRGLNRCSAAVKPLALNEAQGQMEPCKICVLLDYLHRSS